MGTLSLDAQTKLEKDTAKKEAKAEAKADAALKKKLASQVCCPSPLYPHPHLSHSLSSVIHNHIPSIRLSQRPSLQVTIKRIERNKRKHVTSIHGLDAFGIDLKKASKQFSSKFATGSSVTKNPQGQEEIVVQGDVSDEIVEMIEAGVGVLKGIPADNVEVVEEKKKKGGD